MQEQLAALHAGTSSSRCCLCCLHQGGRSSLVWQWQLPKLCWPTFPRDMMLPVMASRLASSRRWQVVPCSCPCSAQPCRTTTHRCSGLRALRWQLQPSRAAQHQHQLLNRTHLCTQPTLAISATALCSRYVAPSSCAKVTSSGSATPTLPAAPNNCTPC